jgi:hypothetical protein
MARSFKWNDLWPPARVRFAGGELFGDESCSGFEPVRSMTACTIEELAFGICFGVPFRQVSQTLIYNLQILTNGSNLETGWERFLRFLFVRCVVPENMSSAG